MAQREQLEAHLPEGDWAKRLKDDFPLWTFAESEPWVEVWQRKGKLEVVERIT